MINRPKASLQTIPLDKLHALRRNPQYLSEAQMQALKASIERDGFLAPIVVRRRRGATYEILSGNHRVMASRELGDKEIACVLVHPCDDARAARIAVNMNTVHGDPNSELIAPFLAEIADDVLREIFLPEDLLREVCDFDATLALRLKSLEVPDALDNESHPAIPDCVCQKCGRRHIAAALKISR